MPNLKLLASLTCCLYTLNGLASYCDSSIINKEKNALIQALQKGDIKRLSPLFYYPLRINLEKGTRSITSANQFHKASKKLLTPKAIATLIRLLQSKSSYICRSNGIGLAGGEIWLDPSHYKIMTLNANAITGTHITASPLYGSAIKPILKDGNHIIYFADINNSGSKKIIITLINQGSMGHASVLFIGEPKGNKLKKISLAIIIKKHFKIEPSNWYYFFGDAFLTQKNNKVFMNYSSEGVTCTYLWQGKSIRLVAGNKQYCTYNH